MDQEKKVIRFKLFNAMISLVMIIGIVGCSSGSTLAPTATFRFAVTDDSRASGSAAAQSNGVATVVLDAIAKDIVAQNAISKVDLVLFPGDLISGANDAAAISSMLDTWQSAMSTIYSANIPIYTTRGNHEYSPQVNGASNPVDPSLTTFKSHFPLSANISSPVGSDNGLTYSFTYKNAKFIAFDDYALRTPAFNNTLFAPGVNKGEMMNSWVLDQINTSTAGVNFVMSHEMMWPSASHRDCLANDPDSRDALVHALSKHNGVYLAGHDHMYVRGTMMTGTGGDRVPSFVVGTAGGGNYDYAPFDVMANGYSGPYNFNVLKTISSSTNPTFGYLLITVYSNNTWKAQFRGFKFNNWNDATDISLTPVTVMDSFNSSDFY